MVPTYFDKSHLLSIRLLQAQQPHSFFNKLNIQQQLIYADFELGRLIRRLILSHQKTALKFCIFQFQQQSLTCRAPPSCSLGCLRLSSLASCAPQTGHLLHACGRRSNFK